jgi:ATP-dependent helicase/nuclease subunit A
MSNPNHEQIPAIEHQGGVLLKAGAGSGKTFVLVEHVIYLTRCWRSEWESKREGEFVDFLAEKYSATVLMTFTKLAAGEILVRLTNRFQKEFENAQANEKSWWQEALNQIERLAVTTIDGFFYRLVRRGFFPNLPPDVAIIMDAPRQKKVLALFDIWWELSAAKLAPDAARDTAMYRTQLGDTLIEIFNDPALRDSWMSFDPKDAEPSKLGWLVPELSQMLGWDNFIKLPPVDVPEEARKKNNKWVALVDALNAYDKKVSSWNDIHTWSEFARSEVGATRLNFGGHKEHVGDQFIDGWRNFKDGVKEWSELFEAYQTHFKERIYPWLQTLHSLVRFVENGLRPAEGLTYGDLEYHVLRSVRQKSIAEKIRNEFTYFVVDEFQDTSRVQYDVLRELTNNDSRKLFCVGDAKQAIYGFRGGELQVFLDLQKSRGIVTLPLRSNYRSLAKIINFNNDLFEKIFPLGVGWTGEDAHAVEMESQSVPNNESALGRVKILETHLPDVVTVDASQKDKKGPKWNSAYINQAEGEVIADYILKRKETLISGSIAVLYKRLAPSGSLMVSLMKRGIGFTAQAKIPFKDDPVTGILLSLIEDILGKKDKAWAQFMISGYLQILQVDSIELVLPSIQSFSSDVKLYGVTLALDLFLARLGLTNSLHEGNLKELRELLCLSGGDLETVALKIKARGSQTWSANFRFGKDPHKVILQTSHGSKGLEYEVVIVAGLVTNGRTRPKLDWIGSLPGAALWVEEASSRKRTPTPQLEFEKVLKKQKDFAESKRLFYVACTRAKEELVFVRFQALDKQLSLSELSWAKGLEAYLDRATKLLFEREEIKLTPEHFGTQVTARPFFHINPLGLSKQEFTHQLPAYGVSPELAVTRLNSLWECPRKFYYKQVLRLKEDEENDVIYVSEDESRPMSSSERGSAIHLGLSEAVLNRFTLPVHWVNSPDKKKMEWALNEVQTLCSGSQLKSEIQMKFPLFGFMLTGIPDLVAYGKDLEIWDYKTGRPDEGTQLKYWQQLMIYAWGHWESGLVSRASEVILRLCYLDTQQLLTKKLSYQEVQTELFPIWKRLSELDRIDETHCPKCPYRSLCPR